jgi:restriction system protein
MEDNTTTMWGIHGGSGGEADSLFLGKNRIAVGWNRIGDLSKLSPNRDAFKEAVEKTYPEKKPGAIPNNAGQLFRFVNEIGVGDWVAYPSKIDRHIHLGRVTGGYEFNPDVNPRYPHQRPVEWLHAVPRTMFSQGALFELGSAMSLFQVKNYVDELIAVLEGQPPMQTPTEDETVAPVASEIEETTKDFILKKLAKELKGHPLAGFVAHILNAMGYHTRVSPEGPDGGIDIIAHKDELGFEPPIIKVQVKSSEGNIGDPVVSALYGKVETNEFGLLVALGKFTPPAKSFARNKTNLRLIDGDELVALILEHYDDFDSRYKGLIPLKRVYVPQPIEEDESG